MLSNRYHQDNYSKSRSATCQDGYILKSPLQAMYPGVIELDIDGANGCSYKRSTARLNYVLGSTN